MTTATTSTDAIVVIDDFGTYNYIIEKNGTGIFRGRVVNVDDEPLVIDVNQVAKDYLFVSVPCLTATTVTQHPDAFGVFTWGSGFNVQDFAIRQDYSGEEWSGEDKCLSTPVNGHADPRQILLYSQYSQTGNTIFVGGGGYYFNVSPNTVSRDSSAQTVYFSVTTNSPELSVTPSENWLLYNGMTATSENVYSVEIGITENSGTADRQGSISFNYLIDESGTTGSTSVSIAQSGATIYANVITYTSTNHSKVTPFSTTGFGANIVSNTYYSGGDYGEIVFDNNVTDIGEKAFSGCTKLKTIVIPETVTGLAKNSFSYCSAITQVSMSSAVTTIGYTAFDRCSGLSSIELSAVTYIDQGAFRDCSGLTQVTLSANLTYIGNYGFSSCRNLNTINFNGTISQWGSITKDTNWHIRVPATVVHCTDGDVSI